MPAHSSDEQFLHRALDLARQGIGLASPNPYVGAVIVDAQGNIAGTGVYTYAGVKHAEVLALEAAGSRARGGTLYINLEPHAHQGRTPPCTDALIAAGIRRAVAAMPDPNPKVSGLGFEKLRAAGIEVDVGQLQEPARRLNENFARYIRHGVPLVTLKSAMTLDGKIAPPPADSPLAAETKATGGFTGHWLTGEAARAHAHKLRHQHDAILVGIGTVLADNPLLTDRSGRPRRRPLLRVILDSQLRLPINSRLIRSAKCRAVTSGDDRDVMIFTSSGDTKKKTELESYGVRVETLPPAPPDGHPDLATVLRRLGELEITSVMIEGGSTINGAAFSAGVVDKVFLYYAPEILGANAVPFATNASLPKIKIDMKHLHRFDQDFAIEGYLRDPYERQAAVGL
jgi:diaminohydroxyphosphoribosylaminopyrimidine deaminase / 5-amino-6-(5-phosphoribosylamino)uracil reductase